MPVMDEFREEREALKHGTPKQKFLYFIDYYKWHVIIAAVILIITVSLLRSFLTRRDAAFYGVFLNAVSTGADPHYAADFGAFAGIDTDAYDVLFDSTVFIDIETMNQASVANSQKMMVFMASGDLDMIVTDAGSIEHYVYLESLTDLRELLTPEQLAKYEPYFYYADKKVMAERAAAVEKVDIAYEIEYPEDPFDPSSMTDPIPVGICMDSCEVLRQNYHFKEGHLVFGVFATSERKDLALKYLEYTFPQ